MLFILQVLLLAAGLLILFTGRAGINRGGLHGSRARLTGLLLMLPLITALILLAIGRVDTDNSEPNEAGVYAIVEYAITLGAIVGAGIIFFTAPPRALE